MLACLRSRPDQATTTGMDVRIYSARHCNYSSSFGGLVQRGRTAAPGVIVTSTEYGAGKRATWYGTQMEKRCSWAKAAQIPQRKRAERRSLASS
jgi:hypothetical protein